MARYTGAVCRLCRREGQKLFLKGERCYSKSVPLVVENMLPASMDRDVKRLPSTVCIFAQSREQDVTMA